MKRITRIILTVFVNGFLTVNSIAMINPDTPYLAQDPPKVTLYAGPQSVMPKQIIYVTVEVNHSDGHSLNHYPVELSFELDGETNILTGSTIEGLASFEVPAQKTTGLMMFLANAGGVKSANGVVVVNAGLPEILALKLRPSKFSNTVEVSIGTVTDEFGNVVTDLSLVTIEWLDDLGAIRNEFVQLSKGQAEYIARCPAEYVGSLKVRASLKNITSHSSDISKMCLLKHKKGGADDE